MGAVDQSDWVRVGRTTRTEYFRLGDDLLIAWPDERSTDDEVTARENTAFQREWFTTHKIAGGVIIFFDRIANQTRGARGVYATEVDPAWAAGVALVGGTMLTRALGSFFMGLTPPRVPTQMFGSLDACKPWLNEQIERASNHARAREVQDAET